MRVSSLASRIGFAAAAFVLGAAVVFHYAMRVLPPLTRIFPELDPSEDGYRNFQIAVCAAAAVAFSLALYELTRPGVRPRKRRGRGWRLACASVFVVGFSLAFNGLGLGWGWDILFAVWLSYTVAYTFVRYGIADDARPARDSLQAYQSRRRRRRA